MAFLWIYKQKVDLKPEAVLTDIQKGKINFFYFLQGEEPFYIDRITDKLPNAVLKDSEKDFNLSIFYGKDTDLSTIIQRAYQAPVFAKKQVIIVKEAQEMMDWRRKQEQDRLIHYCQSPARSTVLVFAYKHKKLDGKTRLAKVLKAQTAFVETKKPYLNQIPPWVSSYCKEAGYTIDSNASFLLTEYIGDELSQLANELDKLFIYLGNSRKKITQEDITSQVGITRKYNVFELQDAIIAKNLQKCYTIIHYLSQDTKQNPLPLIFTFLFNFFTRTLIVQQYTSLPNQELVKKVGVSPYALRKYQSAARSYHTSKILSCLRDIYKADLDFKGMSGKKTEFAILKELIIGILCK